MKRVKVLFNLATSAILTLAFACNDTADDGGAVSPNRGGGGPLPDADAPTAGDSGFGEASQNAICARCDQLL